MKTKLFCALCACSLLFSACQGSTGTQGNTGGGGTVLPPVRRSVAPTKPKSFDDNWTKTHTQSKGKGQIMPRYGRQARRMTVDQIERTITTLFPGLNWTYYDSRRRTNRSKFTQMARTLGKADYLQVTSNTVDPTPLFMKFMDDMAGQVCGKAVAVDAGKNDKSKNHVMRYSNVNQNLRFLRLKFHALFVPPNQTQGIQKLRALYDAILARKGNSKDAWHGVCIAMITSPEFFAY